MSDQDVPPAPDDDEVLDPTYLVVGLEGFDAHENLPRMIRHCRTVHTRNAATKQPCRCGQVHPPDMPVACLILVGTGHHGLPMEGPRLVVRLLPAAAHATIAGTTAILHHGEPDAFTPWATNALCLLIAPPTIPGLICLDYADIVDVLQAGQTGVCGTYQDTYYRPGWLTRTLRSFAAEVGGRTKASMCFIVGGPEMRLAMVNDVCEEFCEAVNNLGVPEDATIEDRDFLFAAAIDDQLAGDHIRVFMLLVV